MTARSPYGTVDQLPSGRHRARTPRDASGVQRSIGTYATAEQAWDALRAVQAVHAEDSLPLGHPDSLRTRGERWLDARELAGVRGIATERSRWRTHLATWKLADAPLRLLRRSDVHDWLAAVAIATSRPTAQRCLSLLRGILDDAAGRDLVVENVARGVRLPGRPGRVEDPWTYLEPAEQRALLVAPSIPHADRLIAAVALGTGMRQGEQCALQLGDVHAGDDEQHPRLEVRRSGKGATKSGKPRIVPLFGLGLAAMRSWLELLPRYAPTNPRKLVFPAPGGGRRYAGHPLGQVYVEGHRRGRWRVLLEGAKLRLIRWHDLRHTCASSLVAGWWGRQWSLEEVCALLGHSSIAVTQRYAHLGDTALRQAAAVTQAASHAGVARGAGIAGFLGVGQEGLEPSTDGLKGPRGPVALRAVACGHDSPVTLAALEALRLAADGDPRALARALDVCAAVLEQAPGLSRTG